MAKVSKSADELRALLIAEAIGKPACPRDIDVTIRPNAAHEWIAEVVATNGSVHADCARWVATIVQRLHREYDLKK